MWQKKYKNVDEFPDGMLPTEFDLRNIAGYDFTGPLRDQSECGSCFTMAYVQAIESRLRLKYAHEGAKAAQQVSPQQVLMCNYMAEGCEGGLAIFDGYLAENGHLTTEECAPYKARTKNDHCGNYKGCPAYAKVNKSYYLNGYNFNPSVEQIKKELMMHGPLVTEFNAQDDFSVYKSGILVQNEKPAEETNV